VRHLALGVPFIASAESVAQTDFGLPWVNGMNSSFDCFWIQEKIILKRMTLGSTMRLLKSNQYSVELMTITGRRRSSSLPPTPNRAWLLALAMAGTLTACSGKPQGPQGPPPAMMVKVNPVN